MLKTVRRTYVEDLAMRSFMILPGAMSLYIGGKIGSVAFQFLSDSDPSANLNALSISFCSVLFIGMGAMLTAVGTDGAWSNVRTMARNEYELLLLTVRRKDQ